MPRKKKFAVRKGHGSMCNICGTNCGKGGALSTHVKGAHGIDYADYKTSFYGSANNILADSWDDSVKTFGGTPVVTHIFVRRFVRHPGKRGVPRAARIKK